MIRWLRDLFAVYPAAHIHRGVELIDVTPRIGEHWCPPQWAQYCAVCRRVV